MNGLHVKYLLVGGGLASSAAAQEIRRRDPSGSILLVAQEIFRPYHRPALSDEYLRREKARIDLSTVPHEWFAEHGIELRTGRRVASLDTPRASTALDNGQTISYDRLLLAIGASPLRMNIPGTHLPNIFYLRTLEDADRLQHAIDKAKREGLRHPKGIGRGTVAIVGGGLLGAELASTLTRAGLHVELIVGEAHPWFGTAGEQLGQFISQHLVAHDVCVHLGHRPMRFEGDGRVQRVILDSSEAVPCDFVIGAIGVNPNRDILRNTPIAAETAILVDAGGRTSVENVFAAGDCAAVLDPLFGKHRVIDHWENALMTGEIAGANMTGADERYSIVNHHVSELFGVPIHIWGERRLVHHRIIRSGTSGGAPSGRRSFVEIGIAADGRVAQIIRVGKADPDTATLAQLVRSRVQTNGQEEHFRDLSLPLDGLNELTLTRLEKQRRAET